jgi:16S rRNA (uracil1498-N3)-methyltransferase
MSSNRFFVPESSIDGEQVRLSREQAHQVCHVLRLQVGQTIVVLDGAGAEYDVTLTKVTGREVAGQVTGQRQAQGEPGVRITLFQSLLARDKFEWVLQKGTEVGITRFAPIATQRSLVRATKIDEKKMTRWRRILTEAAEQSHRGQVPEIDQVIGFSKAVSNLSNFDCALMATPGEESPMLKEALSPTGRKASSIALLIGPEGGFSPDEVDLACENGATRISLGPRIFRTETAAIVASALILYELGQM